MFLYHWNKTNIQWAVLYCAVLCCTVMYCTVLCCAVLYCNVLYCAVLYCNVLCCAVLYCTVLCCSFFVCISVYVYCIKRSMFTLMATAPSCPPDRTNNSALTARNITTFQMSIFRRTVGKIQVSSESQKNEGTLHEYQSMLNSSWNEKCFREKLYRTWKHILCSVTFPRKSCRLWDMEKYGTAGQIKDGNMAHAHCMLTPKATNTHSQYAIFVALPLQQWLHERAAMSRYSTVHCLSR